MLCFGTPLGFGLPGTSWVSSGRVRVLSSSWAAALSPCFSTVNSGSHVLGPSVSRWDWILAKKNPKCQPVCPTGKSRKLAAGSWSYFCFSKGRGRSESNLGASHWKQTPSPFPEVAGAFWGCLGRRWSGSNSSRTRGNFYSTYSTYPNPIKNPWCSQVHMNLSFRSPRLGPQVKIPEAFANRNMSSANPGSNKCRIPPFTCMVSWSAAWKKRGFRMRLGFASALNWKICLSPNCPSTCP